MSTEDLYHKIRQIIAKDKRYSIDAYVFVFQALDYTTSRLLKRKGHVTGKELLEGIRQLAIEQFGPLAKMVFELWGVKSTDDFGEIVFNLVNSSLMGKTDTDTKEDFKMVYDFDEVFSLDAIYNNKKRQASRD